MLSGSFNYTPLHTRGSDLVIDKRLCMQSHDDYFNCLDDQKTDSKNINFTKI